MTQEEFNKVVETQLKKTTDTLIKKQQEYNLSNIDRLEHFKHAAAIAGWTPEKALYGYMLKHLMSITDMINSEQKYPEALWDEKLGDITNYLLLLKGLLIDDHMFTDDK